MQQKVLNILLSPAKALNLDALSGEPFERFQHFKDFAATMPLPLHTNQNEEVKDLGHSGLKFEQTKALAQYLCTQSVEELAELLEISAPLAQLNYERYQNHWQVDFLSTPQSLKPSAYIFNGDAYQNLDIQSLEVPALTYLHQHLLIFSGLYGCLRAFENIKPYRIDMGTRIALEIDQQIYSNLYQIWQPILANWWFDMYFKNIITNITHITNTHHTNNNFAIINLASNEYAKAFSLAHLTLENQQLLKNSGADLKIFDIAFMQRKKDGSMASIGIKNKQARGLFLRYMAQQQVTSLEQCLEFSEDGYMFDPQQSSTHQSQRLVFVQK